MSTRDVVFTREVGRHPRSGVMPKEFWRSLWKIDVEGERTFVLHFDKRHFDYNDINSFELLPEHVEAAAFAEPDAYPTRTRYATEPTNPGLYNGPYRVAEVAPGSHIVLTPQSVLGRGEAGIRAHRRPRHREHRGAGGEPACPAPST